MKKQVVLLFILIPFFAACSGRVPSAKTAHHVVTKNFEKYGKKYKDSDFGKHHLDKVEIVSVKEIQKNMASVEAYTYLNEGPVYWIRATVEKKAYGWRLISWEKLAAQ